MCTPRYTNTFDGHGPVEPGLALIIFLLWLGLFPKSLPPSPSGETVHQTPKSFRGARTRSRSSITMPCLVGVGFHPPPGWPKTFFFTSSIARSTSRRYLIYAEADFEVFHPAGATRCTDGGQIWRGGGDQRSPPPRQISPPSVQQQGCRTTKLKFLLRFEQNVEYKRRAGAYPLRDFHQICSVCTPFQDALAVKIWLDLLEGLYSYGGFKFRGSGFPQIFSAP